MVYVDNMNAPYRGMLMCHMIADTKEELLQMADKIGVNRKWIQEEGTYQEHFDIALSKKKLALAAGAKEITMRELAEMCIKRAAPKPQTTDRPSRLELGIAWMWCNECGGKLYEFDGDEDRDTRCPNPQKCREQRR